MTGLKNKRAAAELEGLRIIREDWLTARRTLEHPSQTRVERRWWRPELNPDKPGARIPPDDRLFAQLGGLARVPERNTEKLRKSVSYELDREWWWHWNPPFISLNEHKRALKLLRQLKESSLKACTALELLDVDLVALLYFRVACNLSTGSEYKYDDFTQDVKVIAAVAKRASEALRHALDKPPEGPPMPRGRPAGGAFSNPWHRGSLARFTLRLLWDVKVAGGWLTLNKNTRKGTLVDALNLFRLYLPPRFVPNVLPVSTLAEVKAVDEKFAAVLEGIDISSSKAWLDK